MAHFAEISQGTVQRVIVLDGEGVAGEAACAATYGGEWKQTSYNATIRKNYAGIGMRFDAERDAFIHPQPWPSWTLDESTCRWVPPVPMPEGCGPKDWNEETLTWGGQ